MKRQIKKLIAHFNNQKVDVLNEVKGGWPCATKVFEHPFDLEVYTLKLDSNGTCFGGGGGSAW